VACVRLDQISEAKFAFEEAIAVDPEYDEAMYNLANLEEQTNIPRCVELSRRAVEIDPEYAMAHQLLGRALQKSGDLSSAEYHFKKCLEINPDDYFSNLFFANLLGVLGRNEEAELAYKHAVALEPELVDGFEFFARFLDSIGKGADAATIRSHVVQTPKKD
jgi:tetratricopeptide (TPR) repeat protein